ncbi:hypothetical protein P280DRAFT_158568 [Massarina eburnea CBS 473.64]|uniref:Uncharacterized protein n=1 Tax=Massarina eburnea CBS 473.64 TaxID=1395130 RepID=A0A6A6RLG1_9PLEO|nr:hypothetical protein P280DRAFT_158568 [Massarina eburnea CBS 473.64]
MNRAAKTLRYTQITRFVYEFLHTYLLFLSFAVFISLRPMYVSWQGLRHRGSCIHFIRRRLPGRPLLQTFFVHIGFPFPVATSISPRRLFHSRRELLLLFSSLALEGISASTLPNYLPLTASFTITHIRFYKQSTAPIPVY